MLAMKKIFLPLHYRQILFLCLFLLIAGVFGHFLIDMTGAVLGANGVAHLHHEVLLQPLTVITLLLPGITGIVLSQAKPNHWLQPPTTPPPISAV